MQKKAATLIELIVAVAIILIIGGVVVVSMGLANRKQLEVDAKILVADIWLYRELAASSRNTYNFTFNTTDDSYQIYNGSITTGELIKTKNLGVDLVTVQDSGGNSQALLEIQRPYNGNAPAQDRIMNLTQNGRTRIITVYENTGYAKEQLSP